MPNCVGTSPIALERYLDGWFQESGLWSGTICCPGAKLQVPTQIYMNKQSDYLLFEKTKGRRKSQKLLSLKQVALAQNIDKTSCSHSLILYTLVCF